MTQKTLGVGILTTQPLTLYLPILQSLTYYQIAIIYDASICPKEKAAPTTAETTTSIAQAPTPDAVLDHPSVDLVLNFMPPSLREKYTVAALSSNKHVLVEGPVSVSLPSAYRIRDAQRKSQGKVFVSSTRRYAPCFETFKTEVASLDRIYYARCRNIQGGETAAPDAETHNNGSSSPNNGSMPAFPVEATTTFHALLQEVFLGQDLSAERILLSRLLTGPRGCPDMSVMRETLGVPDAVSNVAVNDPFYSAIFHYSGASSTSPDDLLLPSITSTTTHALPGPRSHAFMLTYESGTDAVPRCDAHLAVYGPSKTVTLEYDGLGVRVVVESAGSTKPGEVVRVETASSMEDAYRAELEALYAFVVEGRQAKTDAKDSMEDLRLFRSIFEQYDRQCGTIRTPLG